VHRILPILVLAGVCLLPGSPAVAQENGLVGFWIGQFNVSGYLNPTELGVEYRSRPLAYKLQWNLGGAVNADHGGYAFVGGRRDFRLSERWGASLGFGAGLYTRGDGLDLGGPFFFRSNAEIFVLVGRRSRLALDFSHLSNGGIYETNEGANTLALVWAWRLDSAR
jgi:hypothetical protein